MNVLLALALVAGLQESKPVQGRDEILKQDVDNAIKKLGSNRYTESFVAAEELKELGRRAVPALVAELNKKDTPAAVKRALCEILGVIRDPGKDVLSALTAKLKDPDEFGTSIASSAARALTLIGDDGSIPAILETLKSKAVETDRILKYECIRAAGVYRAKDGVEALRKALDDKKPASSGENDDAPLIATTAADALGLIRALDSVDDLANKLSDTTTINPSSSQSLGVHAARALQRILEHELRGKTEKDEPRAGALSGEPAEIKTTLEAWQKWWTTKSAKKNIEETKVRLSKISAAVDAFKKEQGTYPLVLEHLKAKPESAKTWPKDGYYAGDLKDAWSRAFVYRSPGTGADFDIMSYGADQRTWGAGDNADLWSHDKWREAKKAETKKAIEETVKAINQFKADNERYPEATLNLVSRPQFPLKKWPDAGYLKAVPKDAYDNFLTFRIPGTGGEPFDVMSLGADSVEGGTDENEDLWNHDKRPPKKEEPKKDEKK